MAYKGRIVMFVTIPTTLLYSWYIIQQYLPPCKAATRLTTLSVSIPPSRSTDYTLYTA